MNKVCVSVCDSVCMCVCALVFNKTSDVRFVHTIISKAVFAKFSVIG